ncbi:lysophospholipid acyltransferase family protein [Pseudodesulfovibrio sp.]|uniref:lysophospholipid acyltransferase family protein n=1 Tax=Pseudodesulfovibrio sp. TaxID=2035812 RepID=UPI002617A758|nr:lysophospholipid acyltransferase family protein [Pseudodesulfovibrio sp.]MDD3313289.1 lysophospholipid acyltransferase family protein [Pseudodesulfovibrio sp.]
MKISFDPVKLVPLVAALFKGWARSLRYELHDEAGVLEAVRSGREPLVLALWHGELFPATAFGHTITARLVTFVSQSKDGEFIARVIERLGHVTVRGSSTRGGVKALLQAKRVMEKENRRAVFTIDGPKGPRHRAKDGVIFLAQRAGARIVPLRAFPQRCKVFEKSWDRFVLPWPFTRCQIYLGEPMSVTGDKLDAEVMAAERARLEERMLALGPKG